MFSPQIRGASLWLLAAMFVGLLASAAVANGNALQGETQFAGAVTAVTADSLTATDAVSGEALTFVAGAGTKIVRGGKLALLRDVRPGDVVQIRYREINERRMALLIEIRA